jgi:hypothetical protein
VNCRDAKVSTSIARVPIFYRSRHKISQWYAGLVVWPAKTIYLWRIHFMSKKIMNTLLALLFSCLEFFGLDEFGLSTYGSCFLSRLIIANHPSHVPEIGKKKKKKVDAASLSDPSRNHIRPDICLQTKGRKNPTSCVKFCAPIPKIF